MLIDEFYRRDLAHNGDFLRTPTGDLDTVSGLENVKQALFRRLITVPGSLIHRPNYGAGVKRFIGGLNDNSQRVKLAVIVKEQVEQDPRVEKMLGLQVIVDPYKSDMVVLRLRVLLVGLGEQIFSFGIGDSIDGI